MTTSKTNRVEKILLVFWFLLSLVIGVLTVHEYGISIDEPNNYQYAADTLDAYPSFFGILYEPKYNATYDGHGPAFVAIVAIFVKIIQGMFPNVFTVDLWHFSYFISFLLTGLCLYWLTKRWFTGWTAWGILIIFSTQPLLLGHAFVNPKDIPFMFLFTLSVVLGFRLVDGMEAKEPVTSLERHVKVLKKRFHEADPQRRNRFLTYLALVMGVTLALAIFSSQINALMERVVIFFYTAGPDSFAGRIFGSFATHASGIPVEDYVLKVLRLFRRAEVVIQLAAFIMLLAYFGLLIGNTTLPTCLRNTWKQRHKIKYYFASLAKSLRRAPNLGLLKIWLTKIIQELGNARLILAGIALGLATGLRAIAPWTGVIVFLYMLVKVRSRAWTTAIAYFLSAGIVTYIVWPHLWGAPIQHYLEGLGIISAFPYYPQRVLFNGQLYGYTDLPRSYLPVLLNIQFTEPFLVTIYIGLGVLIWRLLHSWLRIDLLLFICLGFAFPLFGLILLKPPLYHNFRQTLFLIPAMSMLAAFVLELIFSKLVQTWARVLLIAAIALPGVYSSIRLYPYEYIYYNSLAGGMAGAHQRYELDYLRISLREAALALNETTPPGATIVVTRSAGLFAKYARPDLVVDKPINSILNLNDRYDYCVQLARGRNWDIYPDAKTILLIEREGTVLAAVKDLRKASGTK